MLVRIAQCESGGNPRAVSRDGRYRGKYQFLRSTWKAWGGRTRDPARASEAHQDRVALKLYRARGTAPWPSCALSCGAAQAVTAARERTSASVPAHSRASRA